MCQVGGDAAKLGSAGECLGKIYLAAKLRLLLVEDYLVATLRSDNRSFQSRGSSADYEYRLF